MSDDEEMEEFNMNQDDYNRLFNPNSKRKKMSKEESMLGIWATNDSDDDENNDDNNFFYKRSTATSKIINFTTSKSSNDNKKKETNDDDETDNDEDIDNNDNENDDYFSEEKKQNSDNKNNLKSKRIFENNKNRDTSAELQPKKQFKNTNPVLNSKQAKDIGNWEKHTKGIGMKLMEKMGWEKGKGIGKDLQGRAIPVEAVVRKGKGAVGRYGPESKEIKNNLEEEEEDEEGNKKPAHVSQWKKNKTNQKLNYPLVSTEQFLEMAANNPQKLKKIEQMLEADESKQKKNISASLSQNKIKIIDMTGKEQRVMHGYESISHLTRTSNTTETKKNESFDLPELKHNIDLLLNLVEEKIIFSDKKSKYYDNTIYGLKYEETSKKEKVSCEKEQIEKLEQVLNLIEKWENELKRNDLNNIDDLIDKLKDLETNFKQEFIIFNLPELTLPLFLPVLKKKMINWNPFISKNKSNKELNNEDDPNDILFCFKSFFSLKEFLKNFNFNIKKNQKQQIIDPYHRIFWECWMPSFRNLLKNFNIRVYSIQYVELIEKWYSLIPNWILENIIEALILPKLTEEVEIWNPLVDTIPIHEWIHPWLILIKHQMDLNLFPTIRYKLSNALSNWHPSDMSAKAILMPWKPPVFSSESWNAFIYKNILPKLEIVLSKELQINPNNQNLEPWEWVMSWFDLIALQSFVTLLEKSFFPKWLQVLQIWLNSSPNYEEVSKWYVGWKRLINEKIAQHPIIINKLTQGLIMMNKSVNGIDLTNENYSYQQKTEEKSYEPSPIQNTSISSFRDIIEKKATENNLVFLPVLNKFKDGKQIFRFGNLNVYLDRNVVFMFLNGSWIPTSINEILEKAK